MTDALLADLRALAEKWKRPGLTCEPWDDVSDDLRDLIAKHTPKPNKCAECGHAHTPMGCTGDPTPSDLWAGVAPAACDCELDVSERDELARVIANANFKTDAQPRLMADAILAAGWRKR